MVADYRQRIADMESTRDDIPFGFDESGNNELAAFKLALAAMDSEPVFTLEVARADYKGQKLGNHFGFITLDAARELKEGNYQLYTAQPAPVVPDDVLEALQKVARIRLDMNDFDGDRRGIADCLCDAEEALIEVVNRRAAMLHAGYSPVIPDGYVMVPKVPSQAHLNSIAMRYRHDFYLLNDAQKDSALATARQMYEECSGQGFYTLPAGPQKVKGE